MFPRGVLGCIAGSIKGAIATGLWFSIVAVLFGPSPAAGAVFEEGIYAVFTTERGRFVCQLHYQRAPRTVANFIGLAEGTRYWLDFHRSVLSRKPLYDGTQFHRVIDDFMIQGGSPNGMGNDHPGFYFDNEIHPELKHDGPGVLSMARLAQPHTNGSQFFVTLKATPWLDGGYSVFGKVIEGMETVAAIGKTETDGTDRPVRDEKLHSVQIYRVGEAAVAFGTQTLTHPLPTIRPVALSISMNDGAPRLSWPLKPDYRHYVFHSSTLFDWSIIFVSEPQGTLDLDAGFLTESQQYFFMVESQIDSGQTR